jgi:hypothetical protein
VTIRAVVFEDAPEDAIVVGSLAEVPDALAASG